MENMERTLRNIIDTKDQEIVQLRHRMKSYQDQNRRLNDIHKTMTVMMGNNHIKGDNVNSNLNMKGIDNLSKIQNMDSNVKPNLYQNIHNKENIDNHNIIKNKDQIILSQLKQQKQINLKLMEEINNMKVKLFSNQQVKQDKHNNKIKKQTKSSKNQRIKSSQQCQQQQKQHQTIPNISSLKTQLQQLTSQRQKLCTKVYQIYSLSNKQGQKHKSNILLLFIQKFSHLSVHQLSSLFSTYSILLMSTEQSEIKGDFIIRDSDIIHDTAYEKYEEQCAEGWRKMLRLSDEEQQFVVFVQVTDGVAQGQKQQQKWGTEQYQNFQIEVINQLLHSIVKAIQSVEESRK